VAAARTGAVGTPRDVRLAPTPVIENGAWETPVQVNAFEISMEERIDTLMGIGDVVARQGLDVSAIIPVECSRERRIFASTDGSYCEQRFYLTGGEMTIQVKGLRGNMMGVQMSGNPFPLAAAGWEQMRNPRITDVVRQTVELAYRARHTRDVEIGRYPIVFDPMSAAAIVNATTASATDARRAMGFDANDDGTSFITQPLDMLGTLRIGASLLNVTADRTMPSGAATVRWDDDGVVPVPIEVVKAGMLNDLCTTRESATWLAPWYERQQRPTRSSGNAASDTAVTVTESPVPNMRVHAASGEKSLDALVAGVDKGYLATKGIVDADQQCLNGWNTGVMFEIKNGKLDRAIFGGAQAFRALEFFRNVIAVGGPESEELVPFKYGKSWRQRAPHTIATPPFVVKDVAVFDLRRRMG
jgi:TldD protein